MKITMLGSIGNINRYAIPQLIESGHQVTVITSSNSRVSRIEKMGAKALVGSMEDEEFLTKAFENQDVVYLMISGLTNPNLIEAAQEMAQVFGNAITNSGVKNVVDLSSIGANYGEEAGSLWTYHYIEDALRSLKNVNVAIVRPVGFYTNLYSQLATIRKDQAIFSNIPEDTIQKYAHPSDIADAVVQAIETVETDPKDRYVVSDTFSMANFIRQLRLRADIPALKFMLITDEDVKNQMISNHVPDELASLFIQTSQLEKHPEKIYADLSDNNTFVGKVKLAEFVEVYAQELNQAADDKQANTVIERMKNQNN